MDKNQIKNQIKDLFNMFDSLLFNAGHSSIPLDELYEIVNEVFPDDLKHHIKTKIKNARVNHVILRRG